MPLNSNALEATDKLKREQLKDAAGKPLDAYIFPDLAEDEYIEIKHVRDYPSDMLAEADSYRRMRPVPLDQETPEEVASKEPVLRRRDDLYWRAVWEYMCVRLHVRIDGEWADGVAARPRGSKEHRDMVWAAWGPYLMMAFQSRFGSIAPVIPDGEVNANGGQADFRQHSGSGDSEDPEQLPGSEGAGGTRPRAKAGTGA